MNQQLPLVLEEDVYMEALAKIIERDYFPNLREMKKQNQLLESLSLDTIPQLRQPAQRLRLLKTRLLTGQAVPTTTTTPPREKQMDEYADMSLDEFQARFTSEDDASFAEMMARYAKVHQERYNWIFNRDHKQLRLTGVETKAIEPVTKFQNALMYYPQAQQPSTSSSSSAHAKQIVAANTRLQPTAASAASMRDADNTFTKASSSSNNNNTDLQYVPSTPSFNPINMEAPIMTWGEIQDTPVVLSGRSFQFPPTPRREIIGHRLAQRAASSMRKRHATKAPLLRHPNSRTPLSPAAKHLLHRVVTNKK